MPGQINLFVPSSLSKPKLSDPLNNNLIQSSFRREKKEEQRKTVGPKYGKDNLENLEELSLMVDRLIDRYEGLYEIANNLRG